MKYEIKKGSTKFQYGMSNPDQLKEWLEHNQEIVGFAFIGRSNVGKSTLINSIFGKDVARTSKTPGRTREINIFSFQITGDNQDISLSKPLYFFDLPGYGHAEVSKKQSENWNMLMGTFFSFVPPSILMVSLQDARHPNQKTDQDFKFFIKDYDFSSILVFNKMDKLKKQKDRAQLNKKKPELFKEYKHVQNIYFVSAEKRVGMDALEQNLVTHLLKYNQLHD